MQQFDISEKTDMFSIGVILVDYSFGLQHGIIEGTADTSTEYALGSINDGKFERDHAVWSRWRASAGSSPDKRPTAEVLPVYGTVASRQAKPTEGRDRSKAMLAALD